MNFPAAISFLVFGVVFALLPSVAPAWCPPTGMDGSSTRGLWLGVMSLVLIGTSMIHFGRWMCASLAAMLETAPAIASAETAALPMPAAANWAEAATLARRRGNRRRAAEPRAGFPLAVPFTTRLLEPQRAA